MSNQPEGCGMCWRGPGSNPACMEHRDQFVERLEADWDRVNKRMIDAEQEAEMFGGIVRALAAASVIDSSRGCSFCGSFDGTRPHKHAQACAWRQARELMADSE